jgi:hypothetical protein
MLGVGVKVKVPGKGVLVLTAAGVLVRAGAGGALVGGMGVMVTMGVTGRSVGEGVKVGVGDRVTVGVMGVGVLLGGGGTVGLGVQVFVGVGVGVGGWRMKVASALSPPCTAMTMCAPGLPRGGSTGVSNWVWNVPSALTVTLLTRWSVESQ